MEEIKDSTNIEILANEANETMILNKYLNKKIELYNKYISLTKNTMQKFFTDKNNSGINLFNSYINEIQKDYDNLKDEYDKNYYPKYQSLLEDCLSDITMNKPILKQYRAEEFILDYLKYEKEDLINGLKKSIKQSKHFHLFREPKRDSLIDMKKGNKEIERTSTELQQNMLYECKQCNKYSYRIKKYSYQIEEIKKNIKLLKKYINEEKSKSKITNNDIENNKDKDTDNKEEKKEEIKDEIKDEIKEKDNEEKKEDKKEFKMNKFLFGKMGLKQSINIGFLNPSFGQKDKNDKDPNNSDENRGHVSDREKPKEKKTGVINVKKNHIKTKKNLAKKRNKIIKEFKKVEDLFDISSEEGEKEKIIDDELHSDDETVFEKKIKQPIQLTTSHLYDIKNSIPDINLRQIEFNKLKIMNEADLYSLQRRKFRSQNIDNNIKELKKKIEKMNDKVNLIQQKEKVMKEYIEKVKEKYDLVKLMKHETSVFKKDVKFIKQSLLGPNYNIEELENEDEDMQEGSVGSDYANEEIEENDKEDPYKFDKLDLKGNLKRSVFVGRFQEKKENKKNKLKYSVQDGMFKNKLKDKVKRKRASSK